MRSGRRRRDKSGESPPQIEPVSVDDYRLHEDDLRDVVSRSAEIRYSEQLWSRCAGIPLTSFLQRTGPQVSDDMAAIIDCCRGLDEPCESPALPFVVPESDVLMLTKSAEAAVTPMSFPAQGNARQELADRLTRCLDDVDVAWRRRLAKSSIVSLDRARSRMSEMEDGVTVLRNSRPDTQLLAMCRSMYESPSPPAGGSGTRPASANGDTLSISGLAGQISDLDNYLNTVGTWYGWIAFQTRAIASRIVRS